ncbi:MAG: GAK system ATP-grasp enzyme [Desulfarculaceae bacterium]|nr:GAK system ATP-grasp enzyme [Desulfarculaceae bacterium]MCF8071537.1 GAK system ATP-grasp enzyme [Desulfarculaceae bacterium]MCF8102352.1 GAK system ATP-grasp enzyme [Desulfarculaceae bacterium]MCF8114816.1 GAK system ATP-grasp enzyme [Desulfarculaceae bacterium]
MTAQLKIAVVGLPGGWSSERLADALAERTGFRLLVDLGKVSCDLNSGKAYFQGTELTALDGLAVKKVGPAYSPELLDRLELLRFMEAKGMRIFSRPSKIIAVLNRLTCTVSLAAGNIPLPPTVVTEDVDQAAQAIEAFGPSVLKPLYTSKARGMALIDPANGVREDLANFKASGNQIIYAQKRLELPGQDLGLVFLGGEYLATYARVGNRDSWNTTHRAGGKYAAYEPDAEVIAMARQAQQIFGLDFTSVDVAETAQGPVVFEVSAFGGFRGLLEGCGIDAAAAYADHIIKELEA